VVGFATGCVDVQYDDALGDAETLDSIMASKGWMYESAGSVETSICLTSPDGTCWELTVDNSGVLQTTVAP